jgi:hypothetical protein
MLVSQLEERAEFKEAVVGHYVVLEKDTLLVTDYTFWGHTYTLSNGAKISGKLLETLTIIE